MIGLQKIKNLAKKIIQQRVVSEDGLKWFIKYDNRYGSGISNRYELDVLKQVNSFKLTKGQVFLDIGAGGGKYAIRLASKGVQVHAWEPNPYNRYVLTQNIALNGLYDKVAVYPNALSSISGSSFLSNEGLKSKLETHGMPVMTLTLDAYRFEKVDLIKMDVEGHESQVIIGAKETLRNCRPKVIFETHPFITPNTKDVCNSLLTGLGYEVTTIMSYDGIYGHQDWLLGQP